MTVPCVLIISGGHVYAYENLYCLEDMNIDILSGSDFVSRYNNILSGSGLKQIIDSPTTRVTQATSTLIDHILTLDDNREYRILVVQSCSDKYLVYLVYCSLVASRVRLYRDFSKFNQDIFDSSLSSTPWSAVYTMKCIEEKVEFVNQNIIEIFKYHAPVKSRRTSRPNYLMRVPGLTDPVPLECWTITISCGIL